MDEDWDNDDFVPAPPGAHKEPLKSQWDDEDMDVKESWEDEDNPKPAAAAPLPTPEPVPASAPAKPKSEKKIIVDKGKKIPSALDKKVVQDEKPLDPVMEKLRQQRLVEEADYQVTAELFKEGGEGRSIEGYIPKSEDDFVEYADLLAHKLRPFEKSFHYLTLLKALMRHATASLKAADAKEVASAMTVIANEKLKAEREATAGKKKTGAKKKQLHVDRPDEESYNATYDDVDDYDFM